MKKIITLFLLMSLTCFGYISVDPVTFDKRIDNEDGTQTFYLSNITKNKLAYRVYVEPADNGNDMSKWIDFYPRSLKIDTGEIGEIRVQIEAPKGTKEGEYTANLVIKEIEDVSQRKDKKSAVKIYTELKMEIAGYVGDKNPDFIIKDFKINKNGISGTIENIGDIRRSVELYLSDGKNEELDIYLGSTRVLAGKSKDLKDFKVPKNKLEAITKEYKQLKIRDKKTDKIIKLQNIKG